MLGSPIFGNSHLAFPLELSGVRAPGGGIQDLRCQAFGHDPGILALIRAFRVFVRYQGSGFRV